MTSISDRHAPWTAVAAEPAVRAAERALVAESATVLADTLAVSVAAEAHRRVVRVLELKRAADGDPTRREEYQRAADELRSWAAAVYAASSRTGGFLRRRHEITVESRGKEWT
jgi:hypothetical protein